MYRKFCYFCNVFFIFLFPLMSDAMPENVLHVYTNHKAVWAGKTYTVAHGKNGMVDAQKKIEGDKATPTGIYPIRKVYYRPDRLDNPNTKLSTIQALAEDDVWSDDSLDPHYNTHQKAPYSHSHEKMWRQDALYNLIIPMGYNDEPALPGKGSAIFIHVAKAAFKPTAGCVAFDQSDLLNILETMDDQTMVHIHGGPLEESSSN